MPSSAPQSVHKIYFWLVEKKQLSQQELRVLSSLSERSVRYALEFLKKEELIVEKVNFRDVRFKKYKLAPVAQLEEQRTCSKQELKLVSVERFAGCGCNSHSGLPKKKEVPG